MRERVAGMYGPTSEPQFPGRVHGVASRARSVGLVLYDCGMAGAPVCSSARRNETELTQASPEAELWTNGVPIFIL